MNLTLSNEAEQGHLFLQEPPAGASTLVPPSPPMGSLIQDRLRSLLSGKHPAIREGNIPGDDGPRPALFSQAYYPLTFQAFTHLEWWMVLPEADQAISDRSVTKSWARINRLLIEWENCRIGTYECLARIEAYLTDRAAAVHEQLPTEEIQMVGLADLITTPLDLL